MFKWETQEFSLWRPRDPGSNSDSVTSGKLLNFSKFDYFNLLTGYKSDYAHKTAVRIKCGHGYKVCGSVSGTRSVINSSDFHYFRNTNSLKSFPQSLNGRAALW